MSQKSLHILHLVFHRDSKLRPILHLPWQVSGWGAFGLDAPWQVSSSVKLTETSFQWRYTLKIFLMEKCWKSTQKCFCCIHNTVNIIFNFPPTSGKIRPHKWSFNKLSRSFVTLRNKLASCLKALIILDHTINRKAQMKTLSLQALTGKHSAGLMGFSTERQLHSESTQNTFPTFSLV